MAIILDRSGSMGVCREETITGFNEQVQKIKGKAKKDGTGANTFVTLTVFNHEVNFVHFADSPGALRKLTHRRYDPDGTTAMLDAIGTTLSRIDLEIKDNADVGYLVIIITDGEENDSHEYSYKRVSEMIQKRQKSGRWTFSYMGANQDLSAVSKQLKIPKSNMAVYTSDGHGTQVSFDRLGESMVGFMDKRSKGTATSDKFFREMDVIRSVEEDEDSSGGGPVVHVIIERDTHGFFATCPVLPGCHTQGDTFEEVSSNMNEAISLYLETLDDDEKALCFSHEVINLSVDVPSVP